jgi:hypothetical protein
LILQKELCLAQATKVYTHHEGRLKLFNRYRSTSGEMSTIQYMQLLHYRSTSIQVVNW